MLGSTEAMKKPPNISRLVPGKLPVFTASNIEFPRLSVIVPDAPAPQPEGVVALKAGPVPLIVITAEMTHAAIQLPPTPSVVSD